MAMIDDVFCLHACVI